MKKNISILITVFMVFSVFVVRIKADEKTTYLNNFDSMDSLDDFYAHFIPSAGTSTEKTADEHWIIEDGNLIRVNDIREQGGTINISALTLRNMTFTNFDTTIRVKYGSTNWGWTVLAFRQLWEGNYFLQDGAGVFIQRNGMVTVWGADTVMGPHEISTVQGFDDKQWHTMRVRVVGNNCEIFVNDELVTTHTLPDTFYREGYVSLQVVNNDNMIDSFSITKLDLNGDPIPLIDKQPETDSESTDETPSGTESSNDITDTDSSHEEITDTSSESSGMLPDEFTSDDEENGKMSQAISIISVSFLTLAVLGIFAYFFVKRKAHSK